MELEEIRKKILPVLQRAEVKSAAIFGSVSRGQGTHKSDIDILIEFGGNKSLLDLVGLKIELEAILGRKMDVLTYKSLHPLLRERILQEQYVIL